jgi:hypothetical protein
MTRSACLISLGLLSLSIVSLGAIGCAAATDAAPAEETLRLPTMPVVWQDAPAGCEETERSELSLVIVANEPFLGALIDPQGTVACVDSLAILAEELATLGVGPRAGDPSPQPARAPMQRTHTSRELGEVPEVEPLVFADPIRVYTVGRRDDPTPTPVTED